MTILFAGSEIGDFVEEGALTNDSTSTRISTDNVRAGILIDNGTDAISAVVAAQSEFWVSWGWSLVTTSALSGTYGFQLRDAAGTQYVRIHTSATNSQTYNVQYWNGSTWVTLGTLNLAQNTLIRPTVAVKRHATDGFIKLFNGNSLVAEVTGDTTGMLPAGGITTARFGWQGNSGSCTFSEVIIADEDTTSMRLATIAPTADGAHTAWTGTFADVDEIGRNAADMIFSGTAGQMESFVMSDVNATAMGTRVVRALVVATHMRRGTTGPQNCNALFRIGAVDYESASFGTINTNAQSRQAIVENSPATSVAWTKTEIDGMEIGLKSVA